MVVRAWVGGGHGGGEEAVTSPESKLLLLFIIEFLPLSIKSKSELQTTDEYISCDCFQIGFLAP